MPLRSKLFYSHLFAMVISILIVAAITGLISPFAFEEITEETTETNTTPNSSLADQTRDIEIIDTSTAMSTALLLGLGCASVVSMGMAFAISLTLSKRMTLPIYAMIKATKRIAEGHYNQRVAYQSQDEIGELAGHFNHMAESLDNMETSRRQLLADLTHELNTPLTSIVGCIEGLQDGTMPSTETNYAMIHDEALRLQRLVRDVQYLSAMEADIFVLHPDPISAYELLQSVASKLHVQYGSKAVQLTIAYPSEALMVYGDRDRIVQVLINLLGNALQYTPSGGQVTVSTYATDGSVEFIIMDTGIGIETVDLKQIFNRFYRVEKSRNRLSGGSGIGLTIAQSIIEAHDGRILAESAGLGQGSQFHFTLTQATTS